LNELERKAWRSVFQDGLWDIYLGLLLVALTMYILLSKTKLPEDQQMVIYIGLMALAMLILWAGKRFITLPRMGHVKFGPKGKAQRNRASRVITMLVLVGAVVFVFTSLALKGDWSEGLPLQLILPAAWAVNMLVLFSLGAYFLDYERLYLVGVLYALPVPLDFWVKQLAGIRLGFIAIAVLAAIILTMGLVVFGRFLSDHPLPTMESPPRKGAPHGNH